MLKFRYLNHTADVEFIAYGSSLAIAVSNALNALFDTTAYVKKLSRLEGRIVRARISIRAENPEDLLWQSLQHALSIGDARGVFFYNVLSPTVKEAGGKYLFKAVLLGKKASPELSKLDVKGISRYNLSIRKSGKRLVADVVVDV